MTKGRHALFFSKNHAFKDFIKTICYPCYIDKNTPEAELRGRVFEQDECCGRGERTRTFDLTVPNRAR